jgi:DNA-binding LacI/PurR family transcriptional regulator
MIQGNYDFESGYFGMQDLLALPDRPTALFCFNDNMAVGATKAAFEAGVKVPDDISIFGFDGSFFSAYTTPALSTVERPVKQMSQEGARTLMEMIAGKLSEGNIFYIETELKIRDSVKNIR